MSDRSPVDIPSTKIAGRLPEKEVLPTIFMKSPEKASGCPGGRLPRHSSLRRHSGAVDTYMRMKYDSLRIGSGKSRTASREIGELP